MNFLKMYYDRVLALVALLFVVVALFILLFKIRQIREGISKFNPIPIPPPKVKKIDFAPVDQLLTSIENPAEWQTNTHRLFQPPLMVVDDKGWPTRAEVDPSDGGGQLGPGSIPVAWYKRFDLECFKNKNIHLEDSDGDSYSNQEEYSGESNPIEPGSMPSPANRLRIMDIYQRDFPSIFVGYNEGQPGVFTVQLNTGRGKTELLQIGDTFGGGYKLKALNQKREKRFNPSLNKEVEEDASTITVVDKNGQDIFLEKNRPGKTSEWFGKLVYLRDHHEFEVNENQDFVLEKNKFKVQRIVPKKGVDIKVGDVVVSSVSKDVTTTYELKPFNPKEDKKGEPTAPEPVIERRRPQAQPPPSAAPPIPRQ
jgi:hypothetical protein